MQNSSRFSHKIYRDEDVILTSLQMETDSAGDGAVSYMLRLTAPKDISQQKPATIPLISYARITIDLRLGSQHRVE